MKKSIFPFLILAALLSGCGSDEPASEYSEGEIKFREAYAEGFEAGKKAFQTTFNEEVRPAYNWLAETVEFYANTVCILSDDKTYHAYYGCWDCPEEPFEMMFISDAESCGYKRCTSCFEEMQFDPLPRHEDFAKYYEPDYPAYTE